MRQLYYKRLMGIILVISFFLLGVSFLLEPTQGITKYLLEHGITAEIWAVLFFMSSLGIATHTVLKWRWNIMLFFPYILHTSAVVFVKIDSGEAPLESVILRITLLILLIMEVYLDWTHTRVGRY